MKKNIIFFILLAATQLLPVNAMENSKKQSFAGASCIASSKNVFIGASSMTLNTSSTEDRAGQSIRKAEKARLLSLPAGHVFEMVSLSKPKLKPLPVTESIDAELAESVILAIMFTKNIA